MEENSVIIGILFRLNAVNLLECFIVYDNRK